MGSKRDALASPDVWLRRNGVALAALTGQDMRALFAIAAAWELYAVCDERGRSTTLNAVVALLLAMQPSCRSTTRLLIARAMNWSDVDRIWGALDRAIASFDTPAPASDQTAGSRPGSHVPRSERIAHEQRALRLVEAGGGGDTLREYDLVVRGELTRDRWDPKTHLGLCPDCLAPLSTEATSGGNTIVGSRCEECGWVLAEDGKRRRSARSTREVIRERVQRGSLDLPPRPNFEGPRSR